MSADFDKHLELLEIVARSLRKANLTINIGKSKFSMKSIRYLGHIVGNGEIKPDPGRVQCIAEYKTPNTVKQVRRFIGMTGWYQRYIQNYSAIAAPMTDLLKKADRFIWTSAAQNAFDTLKGPQRLSLRIPTFPKDFIFNVTRPLQGSAAFYSNLRTARSTLLLT